MLDEDNEKLLPAILDPINRKELLKLVAVAGTHNLSHVQAAAWMKVDPRDFELVLQTEPDIMSAYVNAKLEQSIIALGIIKEVANDPDPENKQRFPAARYLYELFSGFKKTPQTVIAIQNIHPEAAKTEQNIRIIDSLDPSVLEAIKND